MAKQTLKQSVLDQLHLSRLAFTVDDSRCDPAYAEFLGIKVTEVYGSSTMPKRGDNYLICGEYALSEHPTVTVFAAAANSTSTGEEAFLTPGSGKFATYLHVKGGTEPRLAVLKLMIDADKNAIDIHLKQESSTT